MQISPHFAEDDIIFLNIHNQNDEICPELYLHKIYINYIYNILYNASIMHRKTCHSMLIQHKHKH